MSEQAIWRYDCRIPSKAAAGRQVLNDVLDQLEAQHWSAHDVFSVHLAMEEALVNAIRHGNRQDDRKHLCISCSLWTDRIRIEIADEGPGFDPSHLPDPTCPDRLQKPCGRGVMLMRAFMSNVEYSPAGNRVTLEKIRGQNDDVKSH